MRRETVVLLGNLTNGRVDLANALSEFEWSVESTLNLEGLADISSRQNVAVVLIDPAALELPWRRAVSAVQKVAPGAFPILCHRFSNVIDWMEASAVGVFHLLGLPLNPDELRQSLGFVWAERNKRFHVIPMAEDERSRLRKRSSAGAHASGAANVA